MPIAALAADDVGAGFDPAVVTLIQWGFAVAFAVGGWGGANIGSILGWYGMNQEGRGNAIQKGWFALFFGVIAFLIVKSQGYGNFYGYLASAGVGYFGEKVVFIIRLIARFKGFPPPPPPAG